MACHPERGCPPNTHNLHCGYPNCEKGQAERARPKTGSALGQRSHAVTLSTDDLRRAVGAPSDAIIEINKAVGTSYEDGWVVRVTWGEP